MKYLKNLKTSEKISLSFSFFGFLSLLLFLILINITYFFIWYAAQKEMSFSGMNESYRNYLQSEGAMEDIENFRTYLLSRDTIILPEMGEVLCSQGVSKKIHEDVSEVQHKSFYQDGDTVYFIYSQYFEGIGEVKVFFDTTPYIKSQLIIIKTGLIFIFFVFMLQFFMGRYISRSLLKDLKNIAGTLKDVDINSKKKHIVCDMHPDDEIRILAEALNGSYDDIEKQTNKLKQFITDVSHEFKTPLMVMSSEIDVLEKRHEKYSLSGNDIEVFFSHARGNIKKLNTLLETLFYLSRIEEQNQCIVKKHLNIQEFLEKKAESFSLAYADKSIHFIYIIPKHYTIEVEENTFSILIDNILSNAIKFSGKEVSITFEISENSLKIHDTGIGISPEDQEKIWEKFYRKDYNAEGFGVGLFLVKRIVEMYDWNISIESELKKGTTVILKYND